LENFLANLEFVPVLIFIARVFVVMESRLQLNNVMTEIHSMVIAVLPTACWFPTQPFADPLLVFVTRLNSATIKDSAQLIQFSVLPHCAVLLKVSVMLLNTVTVFLEHAQLIALLLKTLPVTIATIVPLHQAALLENVLVLILFAPVFVVMVFLLPKNSVTWDQTMEKLDSAVLLLALL